MWYGNLKKNKRRHQTLPFLNSIFSFALSLSATKKIVSQFTLYGQVLKGSKPDFHLSMKSSQSKDMYHDFLARLRKAYKSDRIKGKEKNK